ncbi:MAG: tRNA-intron lyase [Candidatus Thermoplasmatota archaeon]
MCEGSEIPTGALMGDRIVIEDQRVASQIYNKGYFGSILPGGGLSLNLIEATYLASSGRIQILRSGKRLALERIVRAATRAHPQFEIKFLVYRDMKQRGYVVKDGVPPVDFRVLPRGGAPGKAPSKFWVVAVSERSVFDVEQLLSLTKDVARVRKVLLLAVVDEEGDLTYYNVKEVRPQGRLREGKVSGIQGLLMEDRVLVLDAAHAEALYSIGFYGKPLNGALQISLLESIYLAERGVIRIKDARNGRAVSLKRLLSHAAKIQPDFELRLKIYKDLRAKGILVKTGFKYGSHFRAYEGDPDRTHARYLIHSVPEDYKSMWAEISRAVRLAHGVKKEILLARPKEKGAEYVKLGRMRP